MTLNCKTAYFPVFGVNISQTVGLRTAVARLPLRHLGFLVCCTGRRVWSSLIMTNGRIMMYYDISTVVKDYSCSLAIVIIIIM